MLPPGEMVPAAKSDSDEAAPPTLADVTPPRRRSPASATTGTSRRWSPPALTVTVADGASAVAKPPGVKPLTAGDAPRVKVMAVDPVIEAAPEAEPTKLV